MKIKGNKRLYNHDLATHETVSDRILCSLFEAITERMIKQIKSPSILRQFF